MVGMSPLVARVIAFETMLPATDTAAAHADGLGLPSWKRALGCRIQRHAEQEGSDNRGNRVTRLAPRSAAAPVPSGISSHVLLGKSQLSAKRPSWSSTASATALRSDFVDGAQIRGPDIRGSSPPERVPENFLCRQFFG